MTVKFPPALALALAGLLALGAAGASAAEKKGAKPAEPAKEQAKPVEPPPGTHVPAGEWQSRAVNGQDGAFAYCVTENRFDSGHALIVARNPAGELNLALGIPGAQLPQGEKWAVKVSVDGKTARELAAVASRTDMLVIPQGKDEELATGIMNGRFLLIESSNDKITFQLKGTRKALADLKTCVDKSGQGFPVAKAAAVPPLPPMLSDMLARAGVKEHQPIDLGKVPAAERPADYAWRIGSIVGAAREVQAGADATIAEASSLYVDSLLKRCDGKTASRLGEPETVAGLSLRTASIECEGKEGKLHVAALFYLTPERLFTVIFHEAAEKDAPVADEIRDNLAKVLRAIATAAAEPPAAPKKAQ